MQVFKPFGRDRLIDRPPPHRMFRSRLLDDVFVARRAAGVRAGADDKAAAGSDLALPPPHRMLVEQRRGEVPVNRAEMKEALLLKPAPMVSDERSVSRNASSSKASPASHSATRTLAIWSVRQHNEAGFPVQPPDARETLKIGR